MNKLIFITLCVAIVASKIEFDKLRGFKPIDCFHKTTILLSDAKTFIDHVKSNPLDVATDIQEIKNLLVDINLMLPDCGLKGDI